MTYPCPACGFLTFDGPPGSYAVCAVCGWEDDLVQLAHPRLRGGANAQCLVEAQREALARLPLTIRSSNGCSRDPEWRPLTAEEARIREGAPCTARDYFRAAADDEFSYYWR